MREKAFAPFKKRGESLLRWTSISGAGGLFQRRIELGRGLDLVNLKEGYLAMSKDIGGLRMTSNRPQSMKERSIKRLDTRCGANRLFE